MLHFKKKFPAIALIFALLISVFAFAPASAATGGEGIVDAAGWFESAYAEWKPISGADSYNAYVSGGDSSAWTPIDSELIRQYSGYYRVDAVGLKAGDYKIKIVPVSGGKENTSLALTTGTLKVDAYDRSGYAHFNYTEGVGAYKDDGTLKPGAIVLYVTEATKDTVSVTSKDGTTVVGIGNILNSVGQDVGGGQNGKGGKPNTNADIIRKLAKDGTPLVVRIIGNVTLPAGLTAYDSIDYGGSVGDNGAMARMSGGKDITIEGIGSDAVINGWGIHFICQTADYTSGFGRSFEVRNISFKNVPEDCIGMEGQQESNTLTAPVQRCWIHHCTFNAPVISNPAESDKDGGDGACDFKRGMYFTNSYCHYIGYHKTNLVGSSDDSLQYHLTYHHNYWQDCDSRGPLARQANIHMYNNVFERQTSYCMNPRANAYIFSEYNMFYLCKNPVDVRSGAVKSYNDSFAGCNGNNNATVVTDRATQVSTENKYANFDTNATLSYIPSGDYVIQESIPEMKAVVMAYAGVQKKNPITPDQVNTSIIPAGRYPTAAVVMDYTKSLNKTTVPSSGTYDNIVFNASKFDASYIGIGGTTDGADIVFYVGTAVNVTMTQVAATGDIVLCNESGECMLVGSGTVENLPAGFYVIQSNYFDVGSGKFKEAKISELTITAVDPDAVVTPIPTPTPTPGGGDNPGGSTGGDTGDNPGGDNPGGNQGGTPTTGTVITDDSEVHSFTKDGKADSDGFFTFAGNTSTSKGSVTFNGETLGTCLKMESSTNISFNASKDGTLILVFGGSTDASGKKVKVNGTPYEIPSSQILELALSAGSHTVTKGDSINLFYIAFVPKSAEDHEHNYKSGVTTEPTCTEAGVITYTCACGDSYTATINAVGHSYSAQETTEPTCTEAGVRTYTCTCGATYDETIEAFGHSFTDGTCTNCGELENTGTPGGGDNPSNSGGEDNPGVENPGSSDNTEDKTETPDDADNSGSTGSGEIKTNFLQKFWQAIIDFFKKLFGITKE